MDKLLLYMEASHKKLISLNLLHYKMKIAAGTLILGYTVFLCLIEIISSQPDNSQSDRAQDTTLIELFPLSNGLHFPDIEVLDHEAVHSYPKFLTFNGQHMLHQALTYVKRGHVIFGYDAGDIIIHLGNLFYLPSVFAVFDTEKQQWYILKKFADIKILGVGRNLKLIRAHDEAHAVAHLPYHQLSPQAQPQAHTLASEDAYRMAKNREDLGLKLYMEGSKSLEDIAQEVKETYSRTYNKAHGPRPEGPSGR